MREKVEPPIHPVPVVRMTAESVEKKILLIKELRWHAQIGLLKAKTDIFQLDEFGSITVEFPSIEKAEHFAREAMEIDKGVKVSAFFR